MGADGAHLQLRSPRWGGGQGCSSIPTSKDGCPHALTRGRTSVPVQEAVNLQPPALFPQICSDQGLVVATDLIPFSSMRSGASCAASSSWPAPQLLGRGVGQ